MPAPTLTTSARDGTLLQLRPTGETQWAVHRGSTIVGQIGLTAIPMPATVKASSAAVSITIAPSVAGRGVASGALRAVAGWALAPSVGQWQSLTAFIPVGDWTARRLFWACGFSVTGQLGETWAASLPSGVSLAPASVWFVPPTIGAGSTVLRPLVDDDLDRVVSGCNDPAIRHFLPNIPQPYDAAAASTFFRLCAEQHAAGSHLHWAITAPTAPQLLGVISLIGVQAGRSRSCEIGYWMHADARHRGHTTQAIRLVARHSLLPVIEGGLGMSRVLIRASASNLGSARAAVAAGFSASGRDRLASRLGDGTEEDLLRFDLTEPEL